MREIKFRGKTEKDDSRYPDQWVYGYSTVGKIHPDAEPCYRIHFQGEDYAWHDVRVIPETVGQFTGLKDNNCVEIYEGDVANCLNYIGKVVWGRFLAYLIDCWVAENENGCVMIEVDHKHIAKKCKIIGNIHDNPELLKLEELSK